MLGNVPVKSTAGMIEKTAGLLSAPVKFLIVGCRKYGAITFKLARDRLKIPFRGSGVILEETCSLFASVHGLRGGGKRCHAVLTVRVCLGGVVSIKSL